MYVNNQIDAIQCIVNVLQKCLREVFIITTKRRQRVNINMGTDMHEWLKEVSEELNISVSALIIMAVHNFRQQYDVVPTIKPMLDELNKR